MNIALRLSSPKQLQPALELTPDAIGFGNEGCVYKVPEIEVIRDLVKTLDNAGVKAHLLTPFVPPRHLERMVKLLRELHDWGVKLDVTINDYGVMHTVAEQRLTGRLNYFIGHIYSTSFENCPWSSKVLCEESEFIRDSWCQNNFTNDLLLDHLADHGVGGIEIEMLPIMLNKSAPYLKARNMQVKGLLDYIPSSVTRACHTARYYDQSPSSACADLCDTPINARFTHRYDPENQKTPWLPIDEELLRPWTPDYLLLGNMIFIKRPVELTPENLGYVDEIALDVRPFTWESLAERVGQLRSLLTAAKLQDSLLAAS